MPSTAAAQQVSGYAAQQPGTPAATLDRCLRALAANPKDFGSLISAGKAAVAIGDAQAAAGFFARADEVNPRSPLPQAGMGAVAVANGEARAAMPYFARAMQLGATVGMIGADRGLAYDLMGMQQQAQADYRAALGGTDGDEARRRLALSLAISGDRAGALQTLAPLQARSDTATGRIRAFILALTGDPNGAMAATNAAMPGSWASVGPFLQRLPGLQAAQKAAAVNLGIFPDVGGGVSYATASTAPVYTAPRAASPPAVTDRLAGIDQLLRDPTPAVTSQPAVQSPPARPPQIAYSIPAARQQPVRTPAAPSKPRIWLQLAAAANPAAFATQFRRMKTRDPEVFEGIHGFVAQTSNRSRLLIGPFRNDEDAKTFASNLEYLHINAFSWTNSPSDTIVPLNEAS
ncbi:SPOR domain-containing protein [Sphingomonas sp. F9_3S_D5_B_2]